MSQNLPAFGTHLEKIEGDLKVEIEWIGEGIDGDYVVSDPDDYPHLRFGLLRRDGENWESIEDTSYCTQVDARSDEETKDRLADHILAAAKGETYLKRICENLSSTSEDDLLPGRQPS